MRTASSEIVLNHLRELVDKLDNGARVPTVRDLMKTFRVSQAAVQDAFTKLRDEGLVSAQVGRGTYVVKPNGASARVATLTRQPVERAVSPVLGSLLILSNSSMNERCILVQNRIIADVTGEGGKVVQISYHDTEHLLRILESVPDFDAAILQSHYESIPVRLLQLLQAKARALVTDGHTVCGVDIDRLGTDWEDALDMALEHLTELGHRRIGLVSLDSVAQPILSVRRAFSRLANWRGTRLEVAPPILLEGVLHPSQHVGEALERALTGLREAQGRLPFTALVFVGISDAVGIRRSFERLGIRVPEDLSVHILGHHDVPTEHFDFFTIAGSSHREAASGLVAAIRNRFAARELPPQITFLSCKQTVRSSTRLLDASAHRPNRRSA